MIALPPAGFPVKRFNVRKSSIHADRRPWANNIDSDSWLTVGLVLIVFAHSWSRAPLDTAESKPYGPRAPCRRAPYLSVFQASQPAWPMNFPPYKNLKLEDYCQAAAGAN
jgi:hypothetical protein